MNSPKTARPVVILGAGLAGLSTAYHLKKKPYVLLEKEIEVGGTARSFKIADFTFDFTGHLLHLHTPYTKRLIGKLLNHRFYSCVRKALIFSHHTYTAYPFQANTHGLPDQVVDDCVLGVLEAHLRQSARPPTFRPNFLKWSRSTFGSGISKHFMVPYNEKLYQTRASRLTTEWCGPFVPIPKLDEVILGSLGAHSKSFGYNTTFLYPKVGGIQVLARSLARNLKEVRCNAAIKAVRWRQRRVILAGGETIDYDSLVNTIPLPELLKLMRPLPLTVEKELRRLRFASILCLNLGVRRENVSDASWIYFPEKKYVFYRVGFPMNFTPHAVPKGCSSMYVEIPWRDVKNLSNAQILNRVRSGLTDAGLLRRSDKVAVAHFLPIRYAYVIYDADRSRALPRIFSFLARQKIQSIGRYGAWKYSFMEEAILDGKRAAERLRGSSG